MNAATTSKAAVSRVPMSVNRSWKGVGEGGREQENPRARRGHAVRLDLSKNKQTSDRGIRSTGAGSRAFWCLGGGPAAPDSPPGKGTVRTPVGSRQAGQRAATAPATLGRFGPNGEPAPSSGSVDCPQQIRAQGVPQC
ncbi:hypothetical protein VTN96DRAFT_5697 [Rasamsonia emersonii]